MKLEAVDERQTEEEKRIQENALEIFMFVEWGEKNSEILFRLFIIRQYVLFDD